MDRLISKGVKYLFVLVSMTVLAASCGNDKDSAHLTLDSSVLFFSEAGQSGTVKFTASNFSKIFVTSVPAGWEEPVIDLTAGTILVKAPAVIDSEHVASGSIVLSALAVKGSNASATLFVGVVPTEDLTDKRANSYILTGKNTHYIIDATHKGNSSAELATASVGIIWQTQSSLVQYLELKEGKASFYIGADADDTEKIKQGNALIGAYDASGRLIWSWHLWATNYDPEQDVLTYSNGVTAMRCNLGAFDNANATTDEILASYGLFYQWGRKDPFVGPSSYNASNGTAAQIFNANNSRIYLEMVESNAETGTMEYATANPLKFITGVEESQYDWLWSSHSDALWSDTKSVNDPCPYGWKVPSQDAFSVLRIADKSGTADDYFDKYGWMLTDGNVTSLYMGAGRRVYTDGKIQNVYTPSVRNPALEAQPWVGLYWTTGAAGSARSSAFYFYFDKSDVAASGVEPSTLHYRANGMQIRCVKDRP